jgi:SAM domain (Sterile alpha motif)
LEGGYNAAASLGKLRLCRSPVNGTPMQQIADWLERLGLPEYAERFAENGIDVSVLPDLTGAALGSGGGSGVVRVALVGSTGACP